MTRYYRHTPQSREATVALLTARTDDERANARTRLAALIAEDTARAAASDATSARCGGVNAVALSRQSEPTTPATGEATLRRRTASTP